MNKVRKILLIIMAAFLFALPGNAFSADESVLFTNVPPDVLIVLDLSGSMDWNPAGGWWVYGQPSCAPNTSICGCGGTGANAGYCATSTGSCTTNCSRLNIAKRAIFGVLDDTRDGRIRSTGTNTDDDSLNVRIGYMSFCNGNDTDGNYGSGNIMLRQPIGTRYGQIFCGANTCDPTITDTGLCTGHVYDTQANHGTPLSSSLREAKSYLDVHKAADNARDCRKKFVLLISDGADTFICNGTGSEDVADMYKRRRETVATAKALGDAGYQVFVIGFGGDMPLALRNTLNWAAYYGAGFDSTNVNRMDLNPAEPNVGNTDGYNISDTLGVLYPSGVVSCQTDSPVPATIINNIAGKNGGVGDTVANFNDPATANLSGYAFIAGDANELAAALRSAFMTMSAARYSFTNVSISTARIESENHLYEASFRPIEDEPFWKGHLKKFNILPNGDVGSMVWDAGEVLLGMSASDRNIKTLIGGSITNFTTAIAPDKFGLATTNTTRRNQIVGYIRGEDAFNDDNWRLGDIWHSTPVVITSPSPYFRDAIDENNAFATFRDNNQRTTANDKRVVMAGANDGQFHVFRTSDGQETYSFIPPNMLPKLDLLAHTHPGGQATTLTHQFFVDGPISAADVWLGSGSGTSKSASDWKTVVAFGLGRGANDYSGNAIIRRYLWSANSDCTANISLTNNGYSEIYTAGTPYYCGYYAFDFTDTLSPQFRWRLNPSASDATYLGEPWSKMAIGRVKIGGNEKWVGFIGGGGYQYSCSGGQPPDPGNRTKGFFVVDLSNGNILWRYTKATNSAMNYAIPAGPGIIDADNDGFIDTAYVGDLGGNMWRFKFCTNKDASSCNTSNWSGGLFYDSSTGQIRPIYTNIAATRDKQGNLWVYWGTGDKQCPADPNAQEHFYALKDNDRTTTFGLADIENLTSSGQTYSGAKNGWRIQLTGNGEKILADPNVFSGTILFTTFTPRSGSNPCELGGTGRIYGVNLVGAGALISGNRSETLGTGIPSTPIISLNPGGGVDVHVTLSGGGGIDSETIEPPGVNLTLPDNRSNILYWRDRRVQ